MNQGWQLLILSDVLEKMNTHKAMWTLYKAYFLFKLKAISSFLK